jgi:hypothetical protein
MRFRLPQTVNYWAPLPADAFGRPQYAPPTVLPARWEDDLVETLNSDGDTVLSAATVYLATAVNPKGLFQLVGPGVTAFGPGSASFTFAQLKDGVPGIREAFNILSTPSLNASQTLVKVMLK